MSFLGATGTPVLDFWWHLLWVSKSEWVLAYSLFFCWGKHNVHSPKSTSGATCTNLLAASSTASHFPTCINRGGTWLGFEQAITQTEDERTTIVPATRLACFVFIVLLLTLKYICILLTLSPATSVLYLRLWCCYHCPTLTHSTVDPSKW